MFRHARIVGPIGGGKRLLELDPDGTFDRATPFAPDRRRGRVARTLEYHASACGDDNPHRHLVLRQRAGLVRGDHAGRTERLDCSEVSDDGVPPGHALDANRENRGHNSRQAFWHRRDREGDAKNEDVEERPKARERSRRG